jgi:type IX secretion system PorP/SprF family membrane protein
MRITIFLLALMTSVVANAQQDPQYSQYMFNMLNINPGYAGSRNVLSLNGLHRSQWVNVEGAPRTTSLSADLPAMNNKLGIGLSFIKDGIGRFDNNIVNLSVAYRMKTDRKGVLGMGLSAGVNIFKAELSSIRANPQGTSEVLFRDYSRTYPVLGAGFFYSRDRWYLGLSAPNLLNTVQSPDSKDNSFIRKFQHVYFTGGYVFGISDEVKLKPSFLVKAASGAPLTYDLNVNVWLHDVIGIGASYRINNSVVGMLEIQATRQFRLGYAVDYVTSDLKTAKGKTPLSHELLLRYEFGIQKKKVLSPRYF